MQASGAGCCTNCTGGWTHIHTGRCASTSLSAAYEVGDEPVSCSTLPVSRASIGRDQKLVAWDRVFSFKN